MDHGIDRNADIAQIAFTFTIALGTRCRWQMMSGKKPRRSQEEAKKKPRRAKEKSQRQQRE
jgi:hypothetical protein